MPRLVPNTAPPPDYYADNLLAVATHVLSFSSDLLGSAGSFITALGGLSSDGKRLMARLLSRTTPVIRVDSLNYAEVGDTTAALSELESAQLIQINTQVPADQLLERLKVPELKALFGELVVKKDRKSDLLARVLSSYTEDLIRERVSPAVQWLRVDPENHLQQLQLAYFGDLYRDLTEFVMRDLGINEYETYLLGEEARAFDNATEMRYYRELAALQQLPPQRRVHALRWLLEHATVAEVPQNRGLLRRRDKLLNSWGRDFERSQLIPQAHACYERSTAHPARERRIRLLAKAGDEQSKEALLGEVRSRPWSSEEALFARRFGVRRKTGEEQVVWPETSWTTPHPQLARVEHQTAARLTANGGRAWHTENALLQSLLGLAFWDIVFMPEPGMFTHPFQTGPRDLYWPDFRARRNQAINQRLADCRDNSKLWSIIETTVAQKAGRATRLVHWPLVTQNNGELLTAARNSFSAEQLQRVFDYMLDDLGQVRSGMPDLFVAYGAGRFELVEVKGPTDQLQPNQRVWLNALCQMGIPCRVVKYRSA